MRCEADVTKRNPYMLPPNKSTERCSFNAVGRMHGKDLCGRHIKQNQDAHTRGLAKYCDNLRVDHNAGRHEGQADCWPRCDFCHPEQEN